MRKNDHKAEIEDFKKVVEEYNISLRDFIELYEEYAELPTDVKIDILKFYG